MLNNIKIEIVKKGFFGPISEGLQSLTSVMKSIGFSEVEKKIKTGEAKLIIEEGQDIKILPIEEALKVLLTIIDTGKPKSIKQEEEPIDKPGSMLELNNKVYKKIDLLEVEIENIRQEFESRLSELEEKISLLINNQNDKSI